METDREQYDSEECRAAALALVVASDRLHRAIAAASPPEGQQMLTTFLLSGCIPATTILRQDDSFTVRCGLLDNARTGALDLYERQFVFNPDGVRDALMRILQGE